MLTSQAFGIDELTEKAYSHFYFDLFFPHFQYNDRFFSIIHFYTGLLPKLASLMQQQSLRLTCTQYSNVYPYSEKTVFACLCCHGE